MLAVLPATIHVATDWPAFGLFFLGLVGTFGGFAGWVLRRMDKNRNDWKSFVSREIEAAKGELQQDFNQLSAIVDDNSREIRDQGKAIARIEGRLGTSGPAASQPVA